MEDRIIISMKNKFIAKKIFAIILIATVLISYGNIPSFAVTGNEIAKDGEYKSDEVTVENGDKFSYNLITTLNVADGKFKSVDFSHNGYYGEASVRRSEMAYDYIKQFLVGKESSQSTIDEIDTVAGATFTVNATKVALKNAISKAEARPTDDSHSDDDSIYDQDGKLKDGTYSIDVDTAHNMFKVSECKLIAKGGEYYAICTLASTGFDRLFMGSPAEAKKASNSKAIAGIEGFTNETNSQTTFWPIPVEILDQKIPVATRSAKKKSWYSHTLEFKSNTIQKISGTLQDPTKEQEVKKYIRQFYLDECIFDNLEEDVSKSGKINYTVPFFKKDSTEEITGVKLHRQSSGDFEVGWFISDWDVFSNKQKDKNPMFRKTLKIKDRSTKDNDFKATLKVYDKKDPNVNYTSIRSDKAKPISEVTFNVKLKAAPAPVLVDFSIKDIKTQKTIKNSTIKISDPSGKEVTPNEDGKYKLGVGVNYSLEVSADGYLDKDCNPSLKENLRVTEAGTIEKFLLAEKDSKHLVKMNVLDENKKSIQNAKIEVTHDKTNKKIEPDKDGKYLLLDNQVYTCDISADGYIKKTGQRIKVSDDNDVNFTLRENIKEYNVNIFIYSLENHQNYDKPYQIKVYSLDGENKKYVTPGSDGRYKLKRDVKYYYDLNIEGFTIFKDSKQPLVYNGDEENVDERIIIQPTQKYLLNKKIAEAKELHKSTLDCMGDGPGQYPQTNVEEFKRSLTDAEKVLADDNSKEEDFKDTLSTLNKAMSKLKNKRHYFVEKVRVRVNQTTTGKAQELELTVSGNLAKKYGYSKNRNPKEVTVLDVILAAHEAIYGDEFKNNPKTKFDSYDDASIPNRIFGSSSSMGFMAHNNMPIGAYSRKVVKTGDLVSLGLYPKSTKDAQYLYFENKDFNVKSEDNVKLKLLQYRINSFGMEEAKPAVGYTIILKNKDTGESVEIPVKTDNDGNVEFKLDKVGVYEVDSVYNPSVSSYILPYLNIKVSAKDNTEEPGTNPEPGQDPNPGIDSDPGTDPTPRTDSTKGKANAELIVKEKSKTKVGEENVAKTGDQSALTVYALIAITAIGIGYFVLRKKKSKK